VAQLADATHFPTAETAQILSPQSGGEPVDGVISADPM